MEAGYLNEKQIEWTNSNHLSSTTGFPHPQQMTQYSEQHFSCTLFTPFSLYHREEQINSRSYKLHQHFASSATWCYSRLLCYGVSSGREQVDDLRPRTIQILPNLLTNCLSPYEAIATSFGTIRVVACNRSVICTPLYVHACTCKIVHSAPTAYYIAIARSWLGL